MHAIVETKRTEIARLCRVLGVSRLDLFGSATGDRFNDKTSDIDVLVEFRADPGMDYFSPYFELKEGLEVILDRPVDVVTAGSIKNPFLREQIMRTKETLYAA